MSNTPFYTPPLRDLQKVYISGAMTNDPEHEAKFAETARDLRAYGYSVCSPVETSDILGELSHAEYLRFDFARILEADFVVALPGWEESKGSR